MKKTLLFVCLIVLLLGGCIQPPVQPQAGQENLSSFKDCGQDENCISDSMQKCEKAFLTKTQASESEPIAITSKLIVYGLQEGKCKMKYSIEKVEVTSTDTEADASYGVLAMLMQGKEMTCLAPIEKMSAPDEMSEEEMESYCSGSLLDLTKQMQGSQ